MVGLALGKVTSGRYRMSGGLQLIRGRVRGQLMHAYRDVLSFQRWLGDISVLRYNFSGVANH